MTTTPALTLSSYQDAASATADPRAYDLEYLIPSLVGEAGEMVGQIGKSHWHGWTPDELQTQIIKEYGDVCWVTAILLKRSGVRFVDESDLYSTLNDAATERIIRVVSSIYTLHTMGLNHVVVESAERLWHLLENRCKEVTGVSFETVLRANLAKLADRQARGVLKGQGDNR